ncbi:RNA 2',3'-cyclic phosphodiesterase [Oceanirhabdus sp. W0125-5]|uniref:RNA 2',3'-cyclic phosphodiesterase n=1 Tax=Oceanirhabdus sp. W0125-5 TaxID=2999116 RepID=UPI0022F32C8E|nr:RNA 2',3'-cyclic phosphodiesterase [Oceanirhabdus sp. W0125-5]WBW96803.1 RNA 2',3'-cyclic phosphodiesterase [Oceanirhabdus sp. W0125-5]
MRVFIGIQLSCELKEFLARMQSQLEDNCACGRFTKRENLHITLNFIGELNENKVKEVEGIIKKVVSKFHAFNIEVKGISFFENNNKRLFFAKVEKNDKLIKLQKELSNELSKIGLKQERRVYKPHITIGRNIELLNGYDTQTMEDNCFVEKVKKVTFFESVFMKSGVEYYDLFTERLKK